jgi:hypothetical protein
MQNPSNTQSEPATGEKKKRHRSDHDGQLLAIIRCLAGERRKSEIAPALTTHSRFDESEIEEKEDKHDDVDEKNKKQITKIQIKLKVILEEGEAHRFNCNVFKLRFGGDEERRGERETERGTRRLGEVIEMRDGERHADYALTPLRAGDEERPVSALGQRARYRERERVERGEGCERRGGVLFN